VLYAKGFRLRLTLSWKHPALTKILRLMGPRVASSSIYQLNNFVDTIFGSLAWIVGEGAVAVLYFAYRIIQLPLGIFSTALAQAMLPTLSAQALDDDRSRLCATLSWGLRATFFVLIPASVGLIVLARPIIAGLFQGGRFDAYATERTAQVVRFYAIGLWAFGTTKVLQSCFFALNDTRTPTKTAAVALIMNIILNTAFMFPLQVVGLALASALSGINTTVLLFSMLKKKLRLFDAQPVYASFAKILIASAGMAVVCGAVSRRPFISGTGLVARVSNPVLFILCGGVAYCVFCFLLRIPEMRQLWRWLVVKERTGSGMSA
jgi:putative peptidoglycan lipid II flippase